MSDGNGMSLAISTLGDGARSELGQDRMRPRYKVSQAGVDLIEAFEGLRGTSARLDDGRWTIGYGHTRSAREGAEVSREDALILLRWVDLPPVEEAINTLVAVPLSQNQYDALVAFVFNVGVDAFGESEVLEHLNAGSLTEAACALELWRKADIAGDPVVLDALIRRRAAEKALFLAAEEGAAPTPSPLVRPRPDARAAQFVPARRPAEIEAPLAGPHAEVRLVAPYEIEPELEPLASAFAPEPAAEPALEEEAPTAWTAEVVELTVQAAPDEEAPTAWTAEPEVEAWPEEEAPVTALTALAAWAAEIEGAVNPEPTVAPAHIPAAWTVYSSEPRAAEEALTAEAAAPELEPELEPAAEAETPAEDLPEDAPTAWTVDAVEAAAEESEPPHAVLVMPQPASAALRAAAAETDWDEPAPSSWIIGVTRPAEPTAEPAPEAAAEAAPESVPESTSEAEAEAPAAVEAAPAETSELSEIVRDIPAAAAVLQTRALPATQPRPRPLYSSYGPMAFAVAPPTPVAPAGEGAAMAAPEPAPEPVQAQAQSFEPARSLPHFQPLAELSVPVASLEPAQPMQSFAPPVPAQAQAPVTASAPAVTADAAPAKPLILTSPPADWEEPRTASTQAAPAAEADELETPLFDEGWDGPGALSGRIVHHEAPAEHDARAAKLGLMGPYLLLGFIGFVAFGGALFAFSRGHAANGAAGNPVVLAWILALIGAACVGISVYFLLKRLGGQED